MLSVKASIFSFAVPKAFKTVARLGDGGRGITGELAAGSFESQTCRRRSSWLTGAARAQGLDQPLEERVLGNLECDIAGQGERDHLARGLDECLSVSSDGIACILDRWMQLDPATGLALSATGPAGATRLSVAASAIAAGGPLVLLK